LNLKKRSDAPEAAQESPSTGVKSNPFGAAQPVDVSKQLEKEKEIERKLAEQRSDSRIRSSDGPSDVRRNDRNTSGEKSVRAETTEPKVKAVRPMPTQEKTTFKLDTKSKFAGLGLDDDMDKNDSDSESEEKDDLDFEAVEDPENQDWTAEVE
jgi:hypothetical protein